MGQVKPDFSCTNFGSGRVFWVLDHKIWLVASLTFVVGQKFQPEPDPLINLVGLFEWIGSGSSDRVAHDQI